MSRILSPSFKVEKKRISIYNKIIKGGKRMQKDETLENYLETILILKEKKGNIRAIDISNEMNYAKATISIMLKKYAEAGYLIVEENGNIVLTEKGNAIASKMYERHNAIAKILMRLGVDEKTAYQDSCKIEHDLSEESFQCILEHSKKYEQ